MGRASFTLQRRPLLKRQSGQTLLLQSILTDEHVPFFSGYIYRLLGLISLDESISFVVRKMSPDERLVI